MKRTVLFGLDGATYTVLDDLIQRGVMPYLGAFVREGAKGILESVTPPLTPPAWTTLVTGRSPGQHGIAGFFQYAAPDSSSLQITSSRSVHCETIWSLVNRYGMRAGSLNFVLHAPPPRFDGFVVPGWTPWRWLGRFSRPQGLIKALSADIPGFDVKQLAMDFEIERKAVAGAPLDDYEDWIGLHIERDRQWFSVMKRQMVDEPTELLGIVFDGVDKIQHLLWPFLDPATSDAMAANRPAVRELCWEYFRQIDRFLESTVDLAGPESTVMVASDHGFTGSSDILYINSWLEREGYLTWKKSVPQVDDGEELEPDFYHLAAFDMRKTRAFALTASSNGIHVAVKGGRFGNGIAPEKYEAFRDELIDALLTRCLDPVSGEPVVTRVWKREEVFDGPHIGIAPDLTLTLRDHGFFSVRRGAGIVSRRPEITGTHHPDGVFVARGPGIHPGGDIGRLKLLDIAPTIFHCLGLDPIEEFEGQIPEDLFDGGSARERIHARPAKTAAGPFVETDDAPDEEDEILEKLKALGYIE